MTSRTLKKYQSLGYGKINGFLRDTGFNETILTNYPNHPIVKDINTIDSAMTTKNYGMTTFYRGISNGLIPILLESGSDILINKAYSSSTIDLKIAKESYTSDDGCCVLVFTIPNSIKTYEFKKTNKYTESEVLIQRNTQFRINITKSKHPIYVAELSLYKPPRPISKKQQKKHDNLYQEAMQKMIDIDSDIDWDEISD